MAEATNVKSDSIAESSSPTLPHIDLAEKGRNTEGKLLGLDRRLFMQLSVFGNCNDFDAIMGHLDQENPQAVLYKDINDPTGIAVLSYCEDPAYFTNAFHSLINSEPFRQLTYKPEYTMLGRTYTIGYENDLEEVLLNRPVRRVCEPSTPWAIWYPVRRGGMFERQPREEQRKMLMEHGGIGHAYGKAGFATDIRLAGHGLNKDDNDFIVGLLGKELFPLSALVQHMRKTRQTSEFIQSMGPFFIGQAIWQSKAGLEH